MIFMISLLCDCSQDKLQDAKMLNEQLGLRAHDNSTMVYSIITREDEELN